MTPQNMVPLLDFHTHPVVPEVWPEVIREYVFGHNEKSVNDADKYSDPGYMVEVLAAEGVTHAVVLAEEAPITTGMIGSEQVLDYTAGCPELHAFVSLNPWLEADLGGRLAALMERGHVEGLKFLPPYQHFYPADPRLYPVYARAEEQRLPVMFHTGMSRWKGSKLKYADPLLVDDVAVDFPDLSIVLAHAGRSIWYAEAALLATLHPNVYLDISGLPIRKLPEYFPKLDRLVDKFIFGSDFPGCPPIRELVADVREVFGADGASKVLWENGARLLGLSA